MDFKGQRPVAHYQRRSVCNDLKAASIGDKGFDLLAKSAALCNSTTIRLLGIGARLKITSLRSATGPGVELLEYLAPRGGRPFPVDERPNDLLNRQTVMLTKDAIGMERQLYSRRVSFLSSGLVMNPDPGLGFKKAFVVRDPDGHAVEIEEQ